MNARIKLFAASFAVVSMLNAYLTVCVIEAYVWNGAFLWNAHIVTP